MVGVIISLMTNPYFVNVISDFLFLALLVLLGLVIHCLTRRRALLRFFHIHRTKRINLYLSHLRVKKFGALGVDGESRSFRGTAIPFFESRNIGLFQRLFNYVVPGLKDQPGFLRWLLISDVDVVPLPSPLREEDIDTSTTAICLGSPGYNVVSKWAEERLRTIGRFTSDNVALSLRGLPPLTDLHQGFVQRVVSPEGITCFYAAGPSELGTNGATYFLATQWHHLRKRFGDDKSFCVVVQMAEHDLRVSTIVVERGALESSVEPRPL